MKRKWLAAVLGGVLVAGGLGSAFAFGADPAGASPRVLRVGAWQGKAGQYASIQDAVNAAQPGDWILVGPGDYRSPATDPAGVLITTPGIHLRGMDRNGVIVDGTKPGPTPSCSSNPAAQTFGPVVSDGQPGGRNGIEVLKVSGATVDNLTVCNFLSSAGGDNGNELWFNGGDRSGRIGMGAYAATYVSTTSTYFKDVSSAMGLYGIFASNAGGPGLFDHTLASNMGDSAYYVGACQDCHAVLADAHGSHSALGFSGTNAGGHLIIEASEFSDNLSGIVPNSLNNDDAPPPQNGACPGGGVGPTGSHSCTVIRNNFVHDNNDPNVPRAGIAGVAPVGTGIELSGASNDTVVGNRITGNGSWGILVHDYPDTETPPPTSNCQGGINLPGAVCYFGATGDEVTANLLTNNGFFGNPGNADLGLVAFPLGPGDCFHANVDTAGPVTSEPPLIQVVDGTCGQPSVPGALAALQAVCASGLIGATVPGVSCPSTPVTQYPPATTVTMAPLPAQVTMPNPCAGVPANAWCP